MKKLILSLTLCLLFAVVAVASPIGVLLNLSSNFNSPNLVALTLGFILYFVMYFKAYNRNGFSLPVWFKENWYNLFLITPLCMFTFFLLSEHVSKMEAFAIGVLPNLATDWVMKFIETRKAS